MPTSPIQGKGNNELIPQIVLFPKAVHPFPGGDEIGIHPVGHHLHFAGRNTLHNHVIFVAGGMNGDEIRPEVTPGVVTGKAGKNSHAMPLFDQGGPQLIKQMSRRACIGWKIGGKKEDVHYTEVIKSPIDLGTTATSDR